MAGMASTAMIAAAVSLSMMVVMITMHIRIIAKISCKQCVYSFVCIS